MSGAGRAGPPTAARPARRSTPAPPPPVAKRNGTIRVFHMIKSLGRGGAEMLLPEGLRCADRERFEYGYGYFLPWKDAMVASLEAQGVDVTCFGGRNNAEILLSIPRVEAHLRDWRPDVLHCHMPIAGAVGRFVAGRLRVPVVYSEHNLQERFHPLTRWLNSLTWSWQERAVAVSGEVANSIRATIGTRVPVEVVLNGVDVGRFQHAGADATEVRRRFRLPDTAAVIGTVAVFRAQKALHDWLEAARLLHERLPDVRFLLVGDGPLREEVEAAIRDRELEEIVHLPGLQEDVRPFMATMDVYMMSSLFEGLPIALLEAMAMECVPVCTAVGGIPEVIRSGENGVLVPPRRPDELARAVVGVLEAPERAGAIAAAARRTVVEEFSIARMTRRLEAIYLEAIESHRRRHAS